MWKIAKEINKGVVKKFCLKKSILSEEIKKNENNNKNEIKVCIKIFKSKSPFFFFIACSIAYMQLTFNFLRSPPRGWIFISENIERMIYMASWFKENIKKKQRT